MKLYSFAYFALINFSIVSTASDDQSNEYNYNIDDFSWFTDHDHIVSPEQLHLQNASSSPKIQHKVQLDEKRNKKVKQGQKRRRSPQYYSAALERTEIELKKANEKLEEARNTGKGSLAKQKILTRTDAAIKAK